MEMSILQALILGLISGFTEIFPVAAQAHRIIFLKLFGMESDPAFLRLMIHLSVVVALHFACRKHIVRMMRAQRLALIPKRRRKRPLDVDALMDFNLLKTTLIPTVLAFIAYVKMKPYVSELLFVTATLALNGLILYIPQFLPGANKDSGSMSRIDGLILGLGGGAAVLPGVSCIGATVSVGSLKGLDLNHALNLALVMNIPVNLCFAAHDLLDLFSGRFEGFTFSLLVGAVLAACAVIFGILLGLKFLRKLVDKFGYSLFAFYSWGAAIFGFIFYLMFA